MEVTVEVGDFQAFLQKAVWLAAAGYWHAGVTLRPLAKVDRWPAIDQKLLDRYPVLGLDKYRRAYRKRQGLLNAYLLRHGHQQLILCTEGRDDCGLRSQERLQDARKVPIRLVLPGQKLFIAVAPLEGHWTVRLARDSLILLLAWATELGRKATLEQAIREWAELDRRLPGWRGLIRDKRRILKKLLEESRRAGKKWPMKQFPLTTYRRYAKAA